MTLPVDPFDKGFNDPTYDSESVNLQFDWLVNTELAKINPKFYFVPGNHDPDYSFVENHHARNAHLNPSKIADHLYVIGIGGAKPGLISFEEGN